MAIDTKEEPKDSPPIHDLAVQFAELKGTMNEAIRHMATKEELESVKSHLLYAVFGVGGLIVAAVKLL